MALHRLYIDESGTHGYTDNGSVKQRYLSLAGIFISEEQTVNVLQPGILAMKRLVSDDPDELPGLHRSEIVYKSGAFVKLQDPEIEHRFNEIFLGLLRDMEYCLCSIVLDKSTHLQRYERSALHPYHYCMTMMLERYTFHLQGRAGQGDVMVEARSPEEDRTLRDLYTNFYEKGTFYCGAGGIQKVLTSRELKLKKKEKMIAGLEFSDLLALAMKLDTLQSHGAIPEIQTDNFCRTIIENIQPKYRAVGGKTTGYGKKLVQ